MLRKGEVAAIALGVWCGVLAGCGGCDNTFLSNNDGKLSVDKASLEFGNVYIGASASAMVRLSAEGNVAIAYTTRLLGQAWGYKVEPAAGVIASWITMRTLPGDVMNGQRSWTRRMTAMPSSWLPLPR